jgi:hypothetical protein
MYPIAIKFYNRPFNTWTPQEKNEVEDFLAMRAGAMILPDHTAPAANWLLQEFERWASTDPALALRLDPFFLFVDDLNQGAGGVPVNWVASLNNLEGVIAITLNPAAVAPAAGWLANQPAVAAVGGAAAVPQSIIQFVNGRNDRLSFATDQERQIAMGTIAGQNPQALFLAFNTNVVLRAVQYP